MLESEIINELLKFNGGKYQVSNLKDAYTFCKKLTKSHYENFPVASILLPKDKRKFIFPIYCFSRISDDIADEWNDINQKSILLKNIEKLIDVPNNENPIFFALQDTIKKINLDKTLLLNLLDAFRYDAEFKRFATINDLLYYCSNSANPIGRIVLRIFNEDTKKNLLLSDKICSALQLTNFWQDLSIDIKNNRIYIPLDISEKYQLYEKDFVNLQNKNALDKSLKEMFDITADLYSEGSELIKHIKNKRLKLELKLTIQGGLKILNVCTELKSELFNLRPKLTKIDYINLMYKAIKWKL